VRRAVWLRLRKFRLGFEQLADSRRGRGDCSPSSYRVRQRRHEVERGERRENEHAQKDPVDVSR
jgi:hypothetical protein